MSDVLVSFKSLTLNQILYEEACMSGGGVIDLFKIKILSQKHEAVTRSICSRC